MTAPARPFRQTQNAILRDPETAALYLEESLAAGDTDAFKLALRNVVEAQGGMAALARETELSREALYRTLSESGNPTLETLSKVLGALGLRVAVRVEGRRRASGRRSRRDRARWACGGQVEALPRLANVLMTSLKLFLCAFCHLWKSNSPKKYRLLSSE
jgi:probable addiction module antidote protein